MGGHGHDVPYKIPSPDIYKIENYPRVLEFQQRLAKEGLKDPWLRNITWRYHPAYKTISKQLGIGFRGWQIGVGLFLIEVGINQLLKMLKKDDQSHDGDH